MCGSSAREVSCVNCAATKLPVSRSFRTPPTRTRVQIRADDTDAEWMPPNRYNLTGDRSIPFTTYAKFIVDTATSLGQGGDKGFFKSQAQTHIAHALEFLF